MTNQQQVELRNILHDHGYSLTTARSAVFAGLTDGLPLSLAELYQQVRDKVDRASLYRIIAVFETVGIVNRVHIGWKYKIELSDAFVAHHHHLTCLTCHRIVSINEADLEDFVGTLARDNGFQPVRHQVEIQGYCQECQH